MPKQTTMVRQDRLRDRRQLATYLQDQLRKGPEEFRLALREAVLSQAGGVSGLARRTGLARTGLYKALSAKGNPSYATIQRVLGALGLNTVIALEAPSSTVPEPPKTPKPRILPGSAKGLFVMAEDFDDPLPEFGEYM